MDIQSLVCYRVALGVADDLEGMTQVELQMLPGLK